MRLDVVNRYEELYYEGGYKHSDCLLALAREIRHEALEEAAKVCEVRAVTILGNSNLACAYRAIAKQCADDLRSLKEGHADG